MTSRPPATRRRAATVLGLLGALLTALFLAAAPALAHAQLDSTTPAQGVTVATAPARVTLTFSENIGISQGYVRVTDAKGDRVDTGTASVSGPTAAVALRPGLPDGGYLVSWRVISADSHPVAGSFGFAVGTGTAPIGAAGGSAPEPGGATQLYDAVRSLGYGAIAVLLGGILFFTVAWPAGRDYPRARRLIWIGWWATLATTVLSALLQGIYAAGKSLPHLVDPSLIADTAGTTIGRMFLLRLVAVAVFAWVLRRELDSTRATAKVGAVALGAGIVTAASVAASGHAAAGTQVPLALVINTVHVAAMSAWIGGLVMLTAVVLPLAWASEVTAALPRFSRLALACVATLVATGVYQSWREVGTLPAFWHTGYGQLLTAKIIAVVVVIALAALSRGFVQRRAGEVTEDAGTRRPLMVTVAAELVIAAAILSLTAVFVAKQPAREAYDPAVVRTTALATAGRVTVRVDAPRVGSDVVTLSLVDTAGAPLKLQDLSLTALEEAKGLGPIGIPVTNISPGHWRTSVGAITLAGSWTLTLTAQASEFDQYVASVVVRIS